MAGRTGTGRTEPGPRDRVLTDKGHPDGSDGSDVTFADFDQSVEVLEVRPISQDLLPLPRTSSGTIMALTCENTTDFTRALSTGCTCNLSRHGA